MYPTGPSTDLTRQRLKDLRQGLLRLHKNLLDSERVAYERVHGRIASRGELFQLVVSDPWFAWLHRISELVVQIDEMLDTDEQAGSADMLNLISAARQLFAESGDQEFQQKYRTALQQEPDVVMAHSALMKLLRSKV